MVVLRLRLRGVQRLGGLREVEVAAELLLWICHI